MAVKGFQNRSVMEHTFSEVPRVQIPRSSFNRSHGYKTTFDASDLIPVLVDDIVPGDTFNVNMHFVARLATPFFPIMDNLYLESFFFFVPYRLVWENFKKFHGEQANPADSIDFTIPVMAASGLTVDVGELGNYMGLPIGYRSDTYTPVSALPGRAYRLIYNEWFRDQNIQNSAVVSTDDGPDSSTGYASVPLVRGKRHDYFTSCLPWPQKGDAVSLPLGTVAPIIVAEAIDTGSGAPVVGDLIQYEGIPSGNYWYGLRDVATDVVELAGGSNPYPSANAQSLYADLTGATAATINDLRLAFQTQKLLERDARGGTRYNELILSHFGVTVPDFRIQRPEFLGGGSTAINITPVAQTSGITSPVVNNSLGLVGGFGTVSGSHGFTKSFVEHGVLIGIVNVRGDITYSQGVERYWHKSTRYDFYYPVLAQIGEQAVLNREIWASGAAADELVFGYQERYAEYRYKPSRVTGLFAPDAPSTLAAWHLSEDFTVLPTLSPGFISDNTKTPLDRALVVPTQPQFIFDAYFDMKCARPMPLFGVPGNIDRF